MEYPQANHDNILNHYNIFLVNKMIIIIYDNILTILYCILSKKKKN